MSEQGTVPARRPPAPGEVVVLQAAGDASPSGSMVAAGPDSGPDGSAPGGPDRGAVSGPDGSAPGGPDRGAVSGPDGSAPGGPDDLTVRPRSVLEEERDFFLRSLRDLEVEHDAGDIDDADYDALKDDYTVRAAAVIRQLSGEALAVADARASGAGAGAERSDPASGVPVGEPSPSPSPSASGPRRWPRWRRWTAGAVAAIALGSLAGWAVHRGSGTRLPGQTVSGAPVGPAKLAQLLLQAQKAAAAGDAVTALKDCRTILAEDPNQAQALAEQGWVLAQTQQPTLQTQGLGDLTRAVALDPADKTAHLYRGIVLLDVGRRAEAVTDLQWYLDHNPDPQVTARVQAALVQARAGTAPTGPPPTTVP